MRKLIALLGLLSILGIVFTSCSDDKKDEVEDVVKTGVHKIVVEQSGDIDDFDLNVTFGGVSLAGPAKLYSADGEYEGESYSATFKNEKNITCYTEPDAFFLTCAGSVSCITSGKTLKVKVSAYINDKEVDVLEKEYKSDGDVLVESFSLSTDISMK